MQSWGTSLLIAVLVATVPFNILIKLLIQLPRALALSHRRWPLPLNYGIVAGSHFLFTSYFIHRGITVRLARPWDCRRVPDCGGGLWLCPCAAAAAILRRLFGIYCHRRAIWIWSSQNALPEYSGCGDTFGRIPMKPNYESRPCMVAMLTSHASHALCFDFLRSVQKTLQDG